MRSAGGWRWFDGLLAVVVMATVVVAGGARSMAQVSGDSNADPYPLLFPVAGDHNYVDSFGAPRPGGRTHKGTDIFAAKLTPVVAAADGTVLKVAIGKLAGRYIVIQHEDHWRSYYMHLNNDTPGTDDGLGASQVEGIVPGRRDLEWQQLIWRQRSALHPTCCGSRSVTSVACQSGWMLCRRATS
jgi:hypothetical protein